MPRTGTFGGFAFDPEVFSDYMSEQPTWSNAIIASGILQQDSTIMNLIGSEGNVATLPFYKAMDIADYEPYNNDGNTNNTPKEISGGKQTAMLIQRMMAWKAQDFTKELTGADPIQHIANSVSDYYRQVWEAELMNIVNAVMGLDSMKDHVYNIALSDGSSVQDANRIDETTMIYAQQKALGDMANGFGIAIMNSLIFARYQAMGLVNYNKYTIQNAMTSEVNLPTINGLIPVVSDRFTVDASGDVPKYITTIVGQSAILTAEKTNYNEPYYTDYDAETKAGIEKLYTKEGRVLHPNGFNLKVASISGESPTKTELGNKANWELAYKAKNIRIGQIISNG
nr:MAG TPA: major capsid protein [Caudoviricetes sp.]